MDELEKKDIEITDLKKQVESLFAELANKREDRQLRWNEKLLDNQIKQEELKIDAAKAGADANIDAQKLDLEAQKVAIEAQDKMQETIDANNAMLGGY